MIAADGLPVKFVDLPAANYPHRVELYRDDRGRHETLWEVTVTGPGVVEVPGFGHLKCRVKVRVDWPDGTTGNA